MLSADLKKISIFLLLCLFAPLNQAKMYRWVDEHGRVFFSDKVPQDQSQHKRDALNENARVVETVEKAKTKEQFALEKRLQRLRREQEKIIEKQKSNDKVLLSTFRNLDDMQMALKGKMQAMRAQRKVMDGNLLRLNQQLQGRQKKAAALERSGRPLSKKLKDEIASTRQQIQITQQEIKRHLLKTEQVRREFEEDIERFKYLTQSSKSNAFQLSNMTASNKAATELGLFFCSDQQQCEQAWNIAREFLALHSTTPPDTDNKKLIMHSTPFLDNDISLSVSKQETKTQQQIFLDIRCRASTIGNELCASRKVGNIRRSFNQFITERLNENK